MHNPIDLDHRRPEVRAEYGIVRAEFAARAATRAHAEQLWAIEATLYEARTFPEVFVGHALANGPDAIAFAERSAVADLAVRLSLSEQTIRSQAHQATTLMRRAGRVWSLFRDGDISIANAHTVCEQVDSLPETAWLAFEDAVLDSAQSLAPARFRTAARSARERVEPESFVQRHARSAADRRLWIDPDLDGMSNLTLYSRAEDVHRASANIERIARHLASQADETRTLAQLRADVARDLLAGVLGAKGAVGVSVAVTVPVLTLLGAGQEPGILHGYGPIDAQTARTLAGHAPSFMRLLTHPVSGAVLALDRTVYRPPADLKRWVGARDYQCDFIGCGRLAQDCDIDHLVAWAENGTTSDGNLHTLCRSHHRLKHNSSWHPERAPDGTVTWTSPTGHQQSADPPPF